MVYIHNGRVVERRHNAIVQFFISIINAIVMFFQTLFTFDPNARPVQRSNSGTAPRPTGGYSTGGGGGGGNGGGGQGGGGGGPRIARLPKPCMSSGARAGG